MAPRPAGPSNAHSSVAAPSNADTSSAAPSNADPSSADLQIGRCRSRRTRTGSFSQHLRSRTGLDEWLLRFAGAPLARPQPCTSPPALANIHWHRAEVFRGPARDGV